MSFSREVKEEILRLDTENKCCKISELVAIVRNSADMLLNDNNINILLQTKNALIARKIFELIKDIYMLPTSIEIKKGSKNSGLYILKIDNQSIVSDILKKASIKCKVKDDRLTIKYLSISKDIKNSKCCQRAYIRGFFLVNGSINTPQKNYHLEIVNTNYMLALENNEMISKYGLFPKIITRNDNYIIYLKDGENIADFLNIIKAHKALMKLENIRVIKEVRNNVNRIINCETANLEKTVNTAIRQVEDIKYIEKTIGINTLPKNLQEIAYIRLKNKDLPLKELGQMLNPVLGKSGVNHRLKKIEKIAQILRQQNA